jgi:glucosamine 6-phosphate synthetase-like amidotransferase/phosphosugar isomerase protein
VEKTLKLDESIQALAETFAHKHHALFLGRGALYAIAMEGALKLKEISYIHAEAYAAAELKHGPLALVDEDMPVVAVAPNNELLEKLKSNLQEVRARGGQLFVFADPEAGIESADGVTVIRMPAVSSCVSGAARLFDTAAIARVSRRGAQGHRRRSTAQSRQESHGRVTGGVRRIALRAEIKGVSRAIESLHAK